MAKFYKLELGMYVFDCPGCGYGHHVTTKEYRGNSPDWKFNGDLERPTVSPSLLVFRGDPERQCHSFIKDGQIQFLADCFHELAGKTVELPEFE